LRVKIIAIGAQTIAPAGAVQNLLMNGAFPVHGAITQIYFASDAPQKTASANCASVFVARFACARHCNA
jgi:hypothetical protein